MKTGCLKLRIGPKLGPKFLSNQPNMPTAQPKFTTLLYTSLNKNVICT